MPIRLKPLAEQVIVITGASSGIGLVTARAAAAKGARVMLVARNAEALESAVDRIRSEGGHADFAVADVGSLDEVRASAAKAIARFGQIDTWINNAGVAIYAKLSETPPAEHERMFRTNYFGVVNGALTAVEQLREHGGAIITVGSIAADIPSPIMGAYAATKHAVKAYIGSLRIELMAEHAPISVTLIKPAGIDTPIGEHAANHVDGEARIPPPVYDPALVADAILDAAERPQTDVTVGGIGRLQVLFGKLFPQLFARLGRFVIPLLSDKDHAKTPGNNLCSLAADGSERSDLSPGRRVSVFALVKRNPLRTTLSFAVVVVTAGLVLRRLSDDRRAGT